MEIDLNFMQIFIFFSLHFLVTHSHSVLTRLEFFSYIFDFSPRDKKSTFDWYIYCESKVRWNECISVVEIEYWNFIYFSTQTTTAANNNNNRQNRKRKHFTVKIVELHLSLSMRFNRSRTNERLTMLRAQVEFPKSIHMENLFSRLWRLKMHADRSQRKPIKLRLSNLLRS